MDLFSWSPKVTKQLPLPGEWHPQAVAQVAVTILFAAGLLNLLERIVILLKVPRTASLENQLQLEITDLKRQAATLNHPDTFAQSAKAERKALALEKELLRLQENYAAKQASMILKVPGALRAVSTVVLAVLVMRLPVVAFMRPEAVWPLGRWLAMLSRQPQDVGAVGVLPWALLCHRVTKAALGRVPR